MIHTMKTRRDFLRIGVKTLTAASAVGAIGKLGSINAWASSGGPYQALVCVYLGGGNDSHNMVVPLATAQQGYPAYAASRLGLALAQGSLLPATAKNADP